MDLLSFLNWFKPSSRKTESQQWVGKTFPLEPILTPSGLVDSGDDSDVEAVALIATLPEEGDVDSANEDTHDSVVEENTSDDETQAEPESSDVEIEDEEESNSEAFPDREENAIEEHLVNEDFSEDDLETIDFVDDEADNSTVAAGDTQEDTNSQAEEDAEELTSNGSEGENSDEGNEEKTQTEETVEVESEAIASDADSDTESDAETIGLDDSEDETEENIDSGTEPEDESPVAQDDSNNAVEGNTTDDESEETLETNDDRSDAVSSQDTPESEKSEATSASSIQVQDNSTFQPNDVDEVTTTNRQSLEDEGETIDAEIVDSDSSEGEQDDRETENLLEQVQKINFETGTFIVGESGEVGIDFLFDGGAFKGELGIFSLENLSVDLDSEDSTIAFIRESADRALSSSELGHVVISDRTEGAKFSGKLGEQHDWNEGEYQGVKTFQMKAGDRFGVLFVPNGSVRNVADNPSLEGAQRPLYSLGTANPDDEFHLGQIADVTGEGNTFVMEDLRVDGKSDRDYNDIIFQVRGATGEAPHVSEFNDDLLKTDLGKAIVEYTKPYIIPETPDTPANSGSQGAIDVPNSDVDSGDLDSDTTGENSESPTSESSQTGEQTSSQTTTYPDVNHDNASNFNPIESAGDNSSNNSGNNGEIVIKTESGSGEDTSSEVDTTDDSDIPENTGDRTTHSTTNPESQSDLTASIPSVDRLELPDSFEFDFPKENQPLVGIVDTGFSDISPDIDYGDITANFDAIDVDENPFENASESSERGTHLLGIIKAEQGNDVGIDGINDAVPAWIGRGSSEQFAQSLNQFVETAKESEQPNAVVNISFELTQTDANGNIVPRYELTTAEKEAIEFARQNNIVLVVSAGDSGTIPSALAQASQEFDNIITVGAAEQFDPEVAISKGSDRVEYSNFGNSLDILAEGGTITDPVVSTVGDGAGTMSGTSVATAKVTGSISQIWAANPELSYRQVIDIVKSTATDLNVANPDTETGAGLLNFLAAVYLAKATKPEEYKPIPIAIGDNNDRVPYIVQPNDTLTSIAREELYDRDRWNEIEREDGSKFSDRQTPLIPGDVVYLPIEYKIGEPNEAIDSPSREPNALPQDLELFGDLLYNLEDPISIPGLVYDRDGFEDIDRIDFWIQKDGEEWIDIADVTNFIADPEDDNWARFDYDLEGLESGRYQLRGIVYDDAGTPSDTIDHRFSVAPGNLSDNVRYAIERSMNFDGYDRETLEATNSWVVSVLPGYNSGELASEIGAIDRGATGHIPNTHIWDFSEDADLDSLLLQLDELPGIAFFYPLVEVELIPLFIPNDPLFAQQWHLKNTANNTGGQTGIDINIEEVWNEFTGQGVAIAFVDDGLQHDRPDIQPNYNPNLSLDVNNNDSDPSPFSFDRTYNSSGTSPIKDNDYNFSNGIPVGVKGAITDLKLTFDINHPNPNELDIYLVDPNKNNDDINNLIVSGLSQAGLQTIDIDVYDGEEASGTWTLIVEDTATGNEGTIDSWSLTFNTANGHGTAVAGIAAGKGNNGIGITGVAPDSSLGGIRLISDNATDIDIAKALFPNTQDPIDIFNNSWKPPVFFNSPSGLYSLEQGVNSGRNNLGNVYVFGSGNDALFHENLNLNTFANSRQAIAVGAIDHEGKRTAYSQLGASLLVVAPSGAAGYGLTTTDLTGSNGKNAGGTNDKLYGVDNPNPDYTNHFDGTSAAAPVVSGVVALMLEANPNLTWRDIQHILVTTANRNLVTGDANWQGTVDGIRHSDSYGFGVVDAKAAVEAAKTWTSVAPEVEVATETIVVNRPIPEGFPRDSKVTIAEDINVEWVEVIFDAEHPYPGDLEIELISPSGMKSRLVNPSDLSQDDLGNREAYENWVLTSVRHWGESSQGEWKLVVRDKASGYSGEWKSWQLKVYGTEPPLLEATNLDRPHDYTEETSLNLTDIVVSNNTGDVTATLKLSDPLAGILTTGTSGNVTATYDASTGVWTAIGAVEDVNALLADVRFEPTENYNSNLQIATEIRDTLGVLTGSIALSGINTNDKPTLENAIANQTLKENDPFNFTLPADTFTDIDPEDTLNYTATLADGSPLPGWLTFDPATGTFQGTPPVGSNGTFEVKVVAKDGSNETAEDSFTLTVEAAEPVVSISATDADAGEGNNPGEYTISRTGNSANPLTVNLSLDGTATPGSDYNAIPASITIPGGQATVTIPLNIVNDTEVESDETAILNVVAGNGYQLGSDRTATVNITDNDSNDATVTIVPSFNGSEDGIPTIFNVNRVGGDMSQPLTVNYSVSGTATNGTDYNSLPGSITIPANLPTATLLISPIDDSTFEGEETITLTLAEGTGYTGDTNTGQTATIADNDPETTIVVTPILSNATESGSPGLLNISRIGGDMSQPLTVNYTIAGTATNGTDYNSLSGSITIPENLPTATLLITPIDDSTFEGTETVVFRLAEGTGYGGDTDTNHIVTIADNDKAAVKPTLTMAVTDANASEDGDSAQFTITRNGDTSTPLTVSYSVAGTATNDGDYNLLTGVVTIPAGESSVSVSIDAIDDSEVEQNETIVLALVANSTYDIGAVSGGTVTIADNDVPPNLPPQIANPIGNTIATEDTPFNFTVPSNTFVDSDGDTLTYTAELADGNPLPNWLTFDPATRTFSGTPENGDVGDVDIRIIATDPSGDSVSDIFTVTVANTNDKPVLDNAIPNQNATEDVEFNFIIPANTFSDEDGDNLTYSAKLADGSSLPSWLIFDPNTRRFVGTPKNDDVGTLAIQVTATDPSQQSISSQFSLEVANANDKPTLSNIDLDLQATQNQPLTISYQQLLDASDAEDVDGDDISFVIETVENGTLTKGGVAVIPGVTQLAKDDELVWTPDTAGDAVSAFSVKATDGTETSNLAISVDIKVVEELQPFVKLGDEFQVNTYVTSAQYHPSVAALANGGFIATWMSTNQDGSHYGVFGQQYDRNGNRVGSEFQVNTRTGSYQGWPSVTGLANGDFVVIWTSNGQDGSQSGVYGQRYNSNGNPLGSEFQINAYTDDHQFAESVTSLANGGFIVTWKSLSQDGDVYGIYGQRYDSNGNPLGSEFQVNTYTKDDQEEAEVTALADGGFVIVWESEDQDESGWGIYGQQYDRNGNAVGSEFQANTYTEKSQSNPSVTSLSPDGGFVITWQSSTQNGRGIYGQRYDRDGNPIGDEFQVNTYMNRSQQYPSISSLNDGGFVITWDSYGQDGSEKGVYGQRYDSNGNPIGSEFQVNTYTNNSQSNPSVTSLTTGEVVILWVSDEQDSSHVGIFGQIFGVETPNTPPTLTQIAPLTGATEGQPFTISYADLIANADEADADGDTLSFEIASLGSGTLTKNGQPVTSGTTLAAGESLVWTPDTAGDGVSAFTVKVTDGTDTSATAVSVPVDVATAEPFTLLTTNLQGIRSGDATWGDYDGDGDLDLLLTGDDGTTNPVTKLYRNDGGNFTDTNANLANLGDSDATWGDYDGDGDLDLAISGSDGTNQVTKLYRNDGGNFTDTNATLPQLDNSAIAWGDYDNDGDLDLLLTGTDGTNRVSAVYQNNDGNFTDINAGLATVDKGDVAWGDYDNDGDLDILLTGQQANSSFFSSSNIATIYENNDGNFTAINAGLTGVQLGSVDWGDYDNDGDLDILLTGGISSFGGGIADVFRNDNGNFTAINAGLPGVFGSDAAWGDYDNDGDLDILVSGMSLNNATLTLNSNLWVFENNNGNFSQQTSDDFVATFNGAVDWGDFDGDGDLDIVSVGESQGSIRTDIYQNNTATTNATPTAPTGLNAQVDGTSVTLNWSSASDGKTPTNGLTYNLEVTNSNGVDVLSAMSNNDGTRQVSDIGNVNQNTNWTLNDLEPGTYSWKVQAVDGAFAGSSFANGGTFTILDPNTAPTLTQISTLSGATEGQPFTISYADLIANGNEFDADGDPLSFEIASLGSGTLTKNGQPVTTGTTLSSGEKLVWTPNTTGNGISAFTVKASDGTATSNSAVAVPVNVVPPLQKAIDRASVSSDNIQGNGDSYWSSLSADGRYVAFESWASNLVSGDTNNEMDIFVRDRFAETTELISITSDGTQANGTSYGPWISGDSRYVGFYSWASNLVEGDTNDAGDIFIRDRLTNTTERISVASDGTQGNGISQDPSLSNDGRYVSFWSTSNNLVAGDTNGVKDIFVRDRSNGTVEKISVSSNGTQANGESHWSTISADGRYVVFESEASNLVAGDTNGVKDIFVRDRLMGTTERISISSTENQGNFASEGRPSISADGRYVVFHSSASNLVAGDTNQVKDIFIRDRVAGTTERVSLSSSGSQTNAASDDPFISADGRYISFESSASNLVSGDTNGVEDIFVRDRVSGETIKVSNAADGTQGNSKSDWLSSLSADGSYVSFHSSASNLVENDTNQRWDVFVRDVEDAAKNAPPDPFQNVTVTVHQVKEIYNFDLGDLTGGAEFFSEISIAGNNRKMAQVDDNNNPYPTNWIHTVQVNGDTAQIQIKVSEDDGFFLGTERADISPLTGQENLVLNYNLVTGQITGSGLNIQNGDRVYVTGAGDEKPAAVEFSAYSWEPVNLSGTMLSTIGANLRSGPSTTHPKVGELPLGANATFDRAARGQFINYSQALGTEPTDLWYRISGTNQWVSAAIVQL